MFTRPTDAVTFEWLEDDSVVERVSLSMDQMIAFTAQAMSVHIPDAKMISEMTGEKVTECPRCAAQILNAFLISQALSGGIVLFVNASDRVDEELGINDDPEESDP